MHKSIGFLVCIAWLSTVVHAQDRGTATDGPPERANAASITLSARPLVSGAVEDGQGFPVPNARVWLVTAISQAPEVFGETMTDGDGDFVFVESADNSAIVNAGTFAVWAEHPTEGLGRTIGRFNSRQKPLSIRLAATTKFTGQLVGATGEPLAGVEVVPRLLAFSRFEQLSVRDGQLFPEMCQRLSTTTGDDGRFEMEGLPADGIVHCDVAAPGFQDLRVSWNLRNPQVIRLDPGVPFSGRVSWPDEVRIPAENDFRFGTLNLTAYSQLLEDGTVSSDGKNAAFGTQNRYSVEIDGKGQFRLDRLAPGTYYVSAELSPRLPLILTPSGQIEIGSAQPVKDVVLVAEKAFRISGRVVGFETKEPVANATVRVFGRVPGGLVPNQQATTDDDGRYLVYTRTGKHTLQVSDAPPEYIPSASTFDSEFANSRMPTIDVIGDTECPDLELDSACDVALEVFDEFGNPAAGAIVKIVAHAGFPAGNDYQTEQRTDANGKYIARRVTVNDTLPICVRTPTAISEPKLVITPGELGGPVRIDLSPKHGFRCRFRAVDQEGEPVANATVSLETYYTYVSKWSDPDRMLAIGGMAGEGVTDSDGYFESGPLWPDRQYRIKAEAEGRELAEIPGVQGKAGELVELNPVVLAAAKASKIVGVVVDSKKQPVENVRVFAAGNGYRPASAQTDAAGQFELRELAPDVRYVFVDGGAGYRFGGTRLGNQQPLEIVIRAVDSPPPGPRGNRVPDRDEQLTATRDLIERAWSLPAHVRMGSQPELLRAMVQVDPERALEKAFAIGPGNESHVLAEQALLALDEDPVRSLVYLQTVRNRLGLSTAMILASKLAKSGKEQDQQTANEFVELALDLAGNNTVYFPQLAILMTSLGQHERAQALIARATGTLDLENLDDGQKTVVVLMAPALAPYDYEKARSFASVAAEGFQRTNALANVAVAVAATDYEKAIREIDSLTGDSNAPNIRDTARFRVAWRLVATRPDVAIRLVHQCEEVSNRAQALGRLAVRVAEFDRPQAWKMIETALAIHRDYPDAFRSWSNYGGAGPFAAALAWQAQQTGYPEMESVVWQVLAACRTTGGQGLDRVEATVKTARILALVDKIAARDLLYSVADKTGQFPRNGQNDSLYEQWLQAWLLVDFGRGTGLLGDELDELENSDGQVGLSFGHAKAIRLLAAPTAGRFQMLIQETGLWKLDEDDTSRF